MTEKMRSVGSWAGSAKMRMTQSLLSATLTSSARDKVARTTELEIALIERCRGNSFLSIAISGAGSATLGNPRKTCRPKPSNLPCSSQHQFRQHEQPTSTSTTQLMLTFRPNLTLPPHGFGYIWTALWQCHVSTSTLLQMSIPCNKEQVFKSLRLNQPCLTNSISPWVFNRLAGHNSFSFKSVPNHCYKARSRSKTGSRTEATRAKNSRRLSIGLTWTWSSDFEDTCASLHDAPTELHHAGEKHAEAY